MNGRSVLKKFLKIIIGLAGLIVVLFLALFFALQTAVVQSFLTGKMTVFISQKIKSKVTIGSLTIGLPNSIIVKDLYLGDQNKDTLLEVHQVKLDMNLMSLLSKKIVLNSIYIESLTSHIRRSAKDSTFNYSFIENAFSSGEMPDTLKTKPNTGSAWRFSVKKIALENIQLSFTDRLNTVNIGLKLGVLNCVPDTFDLATKNAWFLNIKKLDLTGSSLEYENTANNNRIEGLDPNHIQLSNIAFNCQDIHLSPIKFSMDLLQLQLQEKCGLNLEQMSTQLSYKPTQLSLAQCELQTGNSKLRFSMDANTENIYVKANMLNSDIAVSDILLIQPALLQQAIIARNRTTIVHINSILEGNTDTLLIQNLEASSGSNTTLKLKGLIKDLTDTKTMFTDLDIMEVKTVQKDLKTLLPPGILPAKFSIPEFLQLKGHVKGTLKRFEAGIDLATSMGELNANVKATGLGTDNFLAELTAKITKAELQDRLLSGELQANLQKEKNRNITGTVSFLNGLILRHNKTYQIDSILLSSDYKDDMAEIVLHSAPVNAMIKGSFNMEEIPKVFAQHFKTYFVTDPDTLHERVSFQKQISPQQQKSPQKFEFKLSLQNPDTLEALFFTGLPRVPKLELKGSYDSGSKNLDLDLSAPLVIYSGEELDSLKLNIRTNQEAFNYSLRIGNVSNARLKAGNIILDGDIRDNTLRFQLLALKDDSLKMISAGGVVTQAKGNWQLHLNSDLVLNQAKWEIDSGNYIRFIKQNLEVQHLVISHENEFVSINSKNPQSAPELSLKFGNFSLAEISRIIENKDSLVRGIVNGIINIKEQGKAYGFTSDITLKDMVFQGAPIGDMTVHADNHLAPDKFSMNLKVTGNQNDLSLEGYYQTGVTENNLHLSLDMHTLNLASIKPFTFQQLSEMSGSASGQLSLSGTTDVPEITGKLTFQDAVLKPTLLSTRLKIEHSSIILESQKIQFKDFELKDSLNNIALINGYADIRNFKNIQYDLQLKTTDFLALNTTQNDSSLYYGKVYLSSDISLKGDVGHPVLKIKAKLNKGSSLIYIRPNDQLAEVDSKGIVEFTDTLMLQDSLSGQKVNTTAAISPTMGIDLEASIEVNKDSKIKILLDPLSGDSLVSRGDAHLNFSLDRNGTTNLTGSYMVTSGSYHLSLNELLKKDFQLEPDSKITWSGDLMDAYLNLSAVYKIKAAPLGLLEGQMTGMSDAQKNMYMTNLDFLVYVKIKGTLEKPLISFDIQQPDDQKATLNGAVDTQLNQLRLDENEMDKQVFALLTLGSFIATDPLNNPGGGGNAVSSAALSGAGSLLSQPLNAFTAKYVKGVDLNLGLNSFDDYSGGQLESRTQVNVGLSKKLFKDKITVQVGGNIDVEGEKAKENNASELAGNVLIEYRLTQDSRYKLKMFQKDDYENPIEGELTETGIGILFTRDFNRVMELWKKR